MIKKSFFTKLTLLISTFALGGCLSATTVGEAPMITNKGVTKTAAFIPVSTNEAEVGKAVVKGLSECLEARHFYTFVPADKVAAYVDKKGYDINKIFGLKEAAYADIAKHFNVDVTFSGSVAVKKSLTLGGWRKDVDSFIRMNSGADGEKLDHWRAMTDATFTNTSTAVSGEKMAKSTVNHICTKIVTGK